MATLSLKKRFSRSVVPLFFVIGFLLCSVIWAVDYYNQRYYSNALLLQKAQAVHVGFEAYLDRANFEVKYLSEQIGHGKTVDSLFQLHDILFFGGLDFFYAVLENGQTMDDPRARLYTRDNIVRLVDRTQVGIWQHVSSSDNGELLVFKKSLENDEDGLSKGYFYGFISLNNNLALASDLIGSAEADYLEINDVAGQPLLVEQLSSFNNDGVSISHETTLSLPSMSEKLAVELKYSRPLVEAFSSWAVIGSLTVFLGLIMLYWGIQWHAQRSLFAPIAGLPALGRMDTLNYKEFKPLLAQMSHFQVRLKARDQHLDLLLNSLQAAILFCDESAKVTDINKEAAAIFPEHTSAKTIFDMTPITCHQPIQRALKGEYGGGFELELDHQPKVYAFQTHTFVNEHGFRSVMIVGRDVSEVRRLRWHLTHRFPQQAIDRPHPLPQLVLQEVAKQSDSLLKSPSQSVSWLMAIGTLIENISECREERLSNCSLGDLVMSQQQWLSETLELLPHQRDIRVELSLDDAVLSAQWTSDHAAMVRSALMLCMHSKLTGRHVFFGWEKSVLTIKVYGSDDSSPALVWLCQEWPKVLKGRYETASGGYVKMTASVSMDSPVNIGGLPDLRVGFIENGFTGSERVKELLSLLPIQSDVYASFVEFENTSKPYHCHYNALLIGMGDEGSANAFIHQLLAANSAKLPVLYLADHQLEQSSEQILCLHQLMAYSLAYRIEQLSHLPSIDMGALEVKRADLIIVGGSAMGQVIWQAELSSRGYTVRREAELENLASILHSESQMGVLILDRHTAHRVLDLNLMSLRHVRWLVVEDFSNRPDTMYLIELNGRSPDNAVITSLLKLLNK